MMSLRLPGVRAVGAELGFISSCFAAYRTWLVIFSPLLSRSLGFLQQCSSAALYNPAIVLFKALESSIPYLAR